jgi:muconate cycloisomerase
VRVVEMVAYHVRIPLRKPIKHASHSRGETDNVLIRCVLDDGTEGFGEGVPRDYVTGETIDSDLALLKRSDLRSQLDPCADFAHAAALAERLRLASFPGDDRSCQGNAARCAVELALLDAFGKRFGEPVSTVTRLLAPELYQPRDMVRYSGAIMSARGLKLRLAAWSMRVYRFRQVKIKVGIAGHDDPARLKTARRILGEKTDIRVDANEAWKPAEAAERIRALEPCGISSVEQPVPHRDVEALAEARRAVHTPIMLDESLCGMVDAEQAVQRGTCDLFNLRLSKCGGFIPSLRLAQFALQHGLGYQLGCQVGETAVLSAAGRHFATSVAELRYLEGSYDHHLVREALATEDMTFGWGGWAPALARPGLAITLDPAALERVTIRKEQLLG